MDRSDPINLADLNEQTRKAIEDVPPWPRPAWLVDQVERMRYPLLWEAVRTTWHRDPSERTSVRSVLVDRVNYILMNQYRQELGLSDDPSDQPAPAVTERMVNDQVSVHVNGVEVPGAEVDTDPFVYGIGAALQGGGVVTAVLPRAELTCIQVRFATPEWPRRVVEVALTSRLKNSMMMLGRRISHPRGGTCSSSGWNLPEMGRCVLRARLG